ncbi:MAG: hypothetical protein KDA21_13290 [Phycisphaerales bacterium]|nr:hypothetical protein [Phycisphaerales bacterium]
MSGTPHDDHPHQREARDCAEAVVAEQLEHPDGQYAPEFDERTARHIADAQLVEALLRHHHATPDEHEAQEHRIQRVLGALTLDPAETGSAGQIHTTRTRGRIRTSHRVVRHLTRWSLAAAVLIAASLWWIATPAPSMAASTLDMAIEAADRAEDRTYLVTIESRPDAPINFHQEARLDTRGGDRFVLRRSTPLGRDLVFGSNGRETWIISPLGAVTVHDGPELLDRWRTRREAMLPFHNLREALGFLDSRYDLRILGREVDDAGRELVHLQGERDPEAGLGPTEADVWCDARTGEVTRLMLLLPEEWSPSGHAARVTFELQDTTPLPLDWFEPEGQV